MNPSMKRSRTDWDVDIALCRTSRPKNKDDLQHWLACIEYYHDQIMRKRFRRTLRCMCYFVMTGRGFGVERARESIVVLWRQRKSRLTTATRKNPRCLGKWGQHTTGILMSLHRSWHRRVPSHQLKNTAAVVRVPKWWTLLIRIYMVVQILIRSPTWNNVVLVFAGYPAFSAAHSNKVLSSSGLYIFQSLLITNDMYNLKWVSGIVKFLSSTYPWYCKN
jgi:hypothetical protein